jgi:hypothetical protein
MRLKCRFPGVGRLTCCGVRSIEMRRPENILLQLQFEGLGTQIL